MKVGKVFLRLSDVLCITLVVVSLAFVGARYFGWGASQATPQDDRIKDPPHGATVDISELPLLGTGNTPVLVEFTDYECPFCKQHATTTFNELNQKFVQTGKIRYALVNFPLDMHRQARFLASAALCAGKQNRYWEAHEQLFERAANGPPDVSIVATDLHLDLKAFAACLEDDGQQNTQIKADMEQARKLGVDGTPSFAIGIENTKGHIIVKKMLSGAAPIATFEKMINDVAASSQ